MDNQLLKKDPDVLPIEAIEKTEEKSFRLPELRRPGLTIFEWNPETDELEPIKPIARNVLVSGKTDVIKEQQTTIQNKYQAKLNHIYVQALNKKNAWKKIKKITGITD